MIVFYLSICRIRWELVRRDKISMGTISSRDSFVESCQTDSDESGDSCYKASAGVQEAEDLKRDLKKHLCLLS